MLARVILLTVSGVVPAVAWAGDSGRDPQPEVSGAVDQEPDAISGMRLNSTVSTVDHGDDDVTPAHLWSSELRHSVPQGPSVLVPIDLGVWRSVSVNALYDVPTHNVLALSLAYAATSDLSGLQFSLGAGRIDRHGVGVQIAGLASAVGDTFLGLQSAAFAAVIGGELTGLQVAGITSVVGERLFGLQLAGVVSAAGGQAQGLQFGGLVSAAGDDADVFQFAAGVVAAGDEVTGMQVAGLVSAAGDSTTGIQFAGLVSASGDGATGLQVGGLIAATGDSTRGAQLAGLVAGAGGQILGLQGAVGLAGADELLGMQVGGFCAAVKSGEGIQIGAATYAHRRFDGLQLGVVNIGHSVHGLQLGLVNLVDELHGVQLGLVNVVTGPDQGVPLGAVSYLVKDSPRYIEGWTSASAPFNIGWRTGTRQVYSLLLASSQPFGDEPRLGAGVGIGLHQGLPSLVDELYVEGDLVTQGVLFDYDTKVRGGVLSQLRLRLGYALGGVAGFAGVGANALAAPKGSGVRPGIAGGNRRRLGRLRGSVGLELFAGLRLLGP